MSGQLLTGLCDCSALELNAIYAGDEQHLTGDLAAVEGLYKGAD